MMLGCLENLSYNLNELQMIFVKLYDWTKGHLKDLFKALILSITTG